MKPILPKRVRRAFSLVEVTLALAVFSVAIIPVMGLLGSGMTVTRASMDDMLRSSVLRQVQAAIQSGESGPFYFAYDGSRVESQAGSLLTVRGSNRNPNDVTAGLAAVDVVRVEISRSTSQSAAPVATSFILRSLDAIDVWGS
ncbi:MAG: hypothetical protein Fur0032_05710 [Terrimicrobiaceae bacterium]